MKINFKKHILQFGIVVLLFWLGKSYNEYIGTVIFLVLGSGFLFAGYFIRNSNRKIQANGIKTKAKIIDFVKTRSMDEGQDISFLYHYFPIVRFTDRNGIEITQKSNWSANPKRINEIIDIMYLKEGNKYEIMINSDSHKEYFPMVFIISGFLFLGIGIICLTNNL